LSQSGAGLRPGTALVSVKSQRRFGPHSVLQKMSSSKDAGPWSMGHWTTVQSAPPSL